LLRPIPAAWRAVDGGTSNLGFMSEVGFREATVGAFVPAGEQPVHRASRRARAVLELTSCKRSPKPFGLY